MLHEHVVSFKIWLLVFFIIDAIALISTKSCEMSQQQLVVLHCRPSTAVSSLLAAQRCPFGMDSALGWLACTRHHLGMIEVRLRAGMCFDWLVVSGFIKSHR